MKTVSAKPGSVTRDWKLVDLDGKTLGRAASAIAIILRGKNKPMFTPHVDTGDFVIAVNVDKIVLTGRKWKQKTYYRHSGYPGGLREFTAEQVHKKYPERLLVSAVKGMLPKNRLGRKLIKKLKIYTGSDHPHQAQKPTPIEL